MVNSEALQGVECIGSAACDNAHDQTRRQPSLVTDLQGSNYHALPGLEQGLSAYESLEGDGLPTGQVRTDTSLSCDVELVAERQLVAAAEADFQCVMDMSCTEEGAGGQQHKEKKKKTIVPAFCADFTPDEQDTNHELMVIGRGKRTKRRQEKREKEQEKRRRIFMEKWGIWSPQSVIKEDTDGNKLLGTNTDDTTKESGHFIGDNTKRSTTATKSGVSTVKRNKLSPCGNHFCVCCGGGCRCGTVLTGDCGMPGCPYCSGWKKNMWRHRGSPDT